MSVCVDWMKVYVIQNKYGIMMNLGVSVKNFNDWSSCEDNCMRNPNAYDCEYNNTCKIDEYLDIKNCSFKKRVVH